jgi:Flp pilus assembly protein CpaB
MRTPGAAAPERTVRVVVAARALPAGHVLAARDLAVARWPARLRPGAAVSAREQLIGARLAGPVGAREPVTSTRLLGTDLTSGLAAGIVATTVPLADPGTADLVHAGDRVDVLATPQPDLDAPTPASTGPPRVSVVATRVRVLAISPATDARSAEAVLAVDRATAITITRDRPAQTFTLVAGSP